MNFQDFQNIALQTLELVEKKPHNRPKQVALVGELEAHWSPHIVAVVMKKWVEYIDFRLLSHQRFSPAYRQLFHQRYCTLEEYMWLFEGKIESEDFEDYPAHEFMMLQREHQRTHFTVKYKPNVEDYFKLLTETSVPIKPFFFKRMAIHIPLADIQKHVYVTGQTGTGKSELLKLLFYDIQQKSAKNRNNSLVLIEPHGDLAQEIRDFVLNKDKERLIYIDPYFKAGYTPIINPFDTKDTDEQSIDIYSQTLTRVFQELIPDAALSRQMDALLKPCISTLLRMKGTTLKDLQDFMHDDLNKDLVEEGKKSPNPNHKDFFQNGFFKSTYKTTKASLYTKLQSLLNSYTFANLMCGKSTIDLESALNTGKVVIFNLSKGKIGTEVSQAYGRFILGMIQSIVLKRDDTYKNKRKNTYLFIDEFQNYISKSIEIVLTETRKYCLHGIFASQIVGQRMSSEMKDLVISNTSVKIVGSNGATSLKVLSPEIDISLDELKQLKEYHFYIKSGSKPAFMVRTPSFLVSQRSKFYLNAKDKQILKDYQLNRTGYYKPLADTPQSDKKRVATSDIELQNGRKRKAKYEF